MEIIIKPAKSQGFDNILVIVDHIFKYGHFLSMKHLCIAHAVVDSLRRCCDFMVSHKPL